MKLMSKNGLNLSDSSDEIAHKFNVIKMTYGNYLNFGIENQIKQFYRPEYIKKPLPLVGNLSDTFEFPSTSNETLKLDVGVFLMNCRDSSGLQTPQYLAIMGRINCDIFDDPFFIGIYHGEFPTPTIGNEIIKPFVTEMLAFQTKSRILSCGLNYYSLELNAFVCDPISNSLLTCTSLPNSLFGCSKCNQQGKLEFDLGFTSFSPCLNLPNLRTDDDFRYIVNNDHHIAIPLLDELNLGLISQFVLDYKIVICQGVMKHMMHLWLNDKLEYRINKETIISISRELIFMTNCCPQEFKKRPRSLSELEDWDAYDYNEFLLFYSPIALKGRMQQKYYVHFLYFHLAMRILMAGEKYSDCNAYIIGHLLNKFVADFIELYGKDRIDYNVHNLLHFENLQSKMGSLCQLNGFTYEKLMCMLDSLISVAPTPNLSEIGEKITENTNIIFDNKTNELINHKFPYIEDDGNLVYKNFVVTTKEPDNHVITKDGIIRVEAICPAEDDPSDILLIGKLYLQHEIMYQAAFTNQRMLLVSQLSELQTFHAKDLLFKAVKIEISDGIYILPLI
jgi:hypothetical protein